VNVGPGIIVYYGYPSRKVRPTLAIENDVDQKSAISCGNDPVRERYSAGTKFSGSDILPGAIFCRERYSAGTIFSGTIFSGERYFSGSDILRERYFSGNDILRERYSPGTIFSGNDILWERYSLGTIFSGERYSPGNDISPGTIFSGNDILWERYSLGTIFSGNDILWERYSLGTIFSGNKILRERYFSGNDILRVPHPLRSHRKGWDEQRLVSHRPLPVLFTPPKEPSFRPKLLTPL
jgi:hypothetical protein